MNEEKWTFTPELKWVEAYVNDSGTAYHIPSYKIPRLIRLEAKNAELQKKLDEAVKVIEMVEDHRKMPHQHSDLQTRLYCLTERATEFLKSFGVKE